MKTSSAFLANCRVMLCHVPAVAWPRTMFSVIKYDPFTWHLGIACFPFQPHGDSFGIRLHKNIIIVGYDDKFSNSEILKSAINY